MSILRVKTTEARVGVVGLYSSGKTVLLTSLINHLQDHDPDRFPLGSKETRLRKFTVHAPDRGLGRVQLHRPPRRARQRRPLAREDHRPLAVRLPVRALRLDVQRLPAETLRPARRAHRRRRHGRPRLHRLVGADARALRQRRELPHLLRPVPRRDQEAGRDRRRAAPRLQARAREPDPELQAADLAVDVPARHAGPAGPAGHGRRTSRRRGSAGIDAESEFCPLPADLRVAGLEAVRGLLVPLSAATSSRSSSRRSSRSSRARRSSCWWT